MVSGDEQDIGYQSGAKWNKHTYDELDREANLIDVHNNYERLHSWLIWKQDHVED